MLTRRARKEMHKRSLGDLILFHDVREIILEQLLSKSTDGFTAYDDCLRLISVSKELLYNEHIAQWLAKKLEHEEVKTSLFTVGCDFPQGDLHCTLKCWEDCWNWIEAHGVIRGSKGQSRTKMERKLKHFALLSHMGSSRFFMASPPHWVPLLFGPPSTHNGTNQANPTDLVYRKPGFF